MCVCVCVCADLRQPLGEAGGLSLGEGQEEGLLPESSQSWNVSESKEMENNLSLTEKKKFFHTNIKVDIFSYKSLQMQIIGRSRMDSFFFFFLVASAASPLCPSFLFRVANRMLIAAWQTQQVKPRKQSG